MTRPEPDSLARLTAARVRRAAERLRAADVALGSAILDADGDALPQALRGREEALEATEVLVLALAGEGHRAVEHAALVREARDALAASQERQAALEQALIRRRAEVERALRAEAEIALSAQVRGSYGMPAPGRRVTLRG